MRIRPNTTGFKQEAETGIKGAFRSIGKLTIAAVGVTGVAEATKSVVEAAAKQQVALNQTRKSVENANAAWVVHGKTVATVLETNARATGFTVADLAQSFSKAVAATQDSTKAFRILKDAEDLARVSGRSLSQATLTVQRAYQGSSQSLRRYGIVIPAVTAAEDALKRSHETLIAQGAKFTAAQNVQYKNALDLAKARDKLASSTNVLNVIEQKFGGQAALFANSTSGQLARLKETLNQLEVTIGKQLLPTLNVGLAGLRRWVDELRTSVTLHNTVSAVVVGLKSAFTGVVNVLRIVSPLISEVAKATAGLVQAAGGGGLLAIVVGYKALSVAVGAASIVQKKYASVLAAGAAASTENAVATAATTKAQASAGPILSRNTVVWDQNTAAVSVYTAAQIKATVAATEAAKVTEAQTAALLEEAAAYKVTSVAAFGGGQMVRNANGQFVTTTKAIDDMGKSTFKFGTLARGVFTSLGGWTTVAQIGIAALAFGIYKLVTADSALEAANKRVQASQEALNKSRQALLNLQTREAALKQAVPEDKLSVQSAQLQVVRANQAVAATRPGTTAHAEAVVGLKQALRFEIDAVAQLTKDHKDLAKVEGAIPYQQSKNSKALIETAKRLRDVANAAKENALATSVAHGLRPPPPTVASANDAAKQLAIQRATAEAFRQQALADSRKAGNVLAHHNDELLAQLTHQLGKVPQDHTIRFILANTDAKKGLADIEKDLATSTKRSNDRAATGGKKVGSSFGQSVADGIRASFPVVVSAIDALAEKMSKTASSQSVTVTVNAPPTRKASGGVIGGSGSGDTVPAMLTPGEVVLNRGQQKRLSHKLGMPYGGPHNLFRVAQGFQDGGVAGENLPAWVKTPEQALAWLRRGQNKSDAYLRSHGGNSSFGRLTHKFLSTLGQATVGIDPYHPLALVKAAHAQAVAVAHPNAKTSERSIVGALLSGAFGIPRGGLNAKDMQFTWKNESGPHADSTRAVSATLKGQNEGRPVGRLSITRKGSGWEVLNAVVHPSYQRQGIATALFREAENQVGPGRLKHSKLLTDDGKAFAKSVRPHKGTTRTIFGAKSADAEIENLFEELKADPRWKNEAYNVAYNALDDADRDALPLIVARNAKRELVGLGSFDLKPGEAGGIAHGGNVGGVGGGGLQVIKRLMQHVAQEKKGLEFHAAPTGIPLYRKLGMNVKVNPDGYGDVQLTASEVAKLAKDIRALARKHAHGGVVGLRGGGIAGMDSVPAMLSPGEIVLNHKQQQNVAGMLGMGAGGVVNPQALFNFVTGRGFATGGVVGSTYGIGSDQDTLSLKQLAVDTQAKVNRLLGFDATKLHQATANITDQMSSLADAIKQSVQTIHDSIISAKQNLNSIGTSFASDIQAFLDKKQAQSQAPTGPVAARLKALDAQIAAGNATPTLVRAAQALSDQLAAQQTVASAKAGAGDTKAQIAATKIANASDLLNKGAITYHQFIKRIDAIEKAAGFSFSKDQKRLGIAAADQARADRKGLSDQAKAIVASPKFGGTGLEPAIIRPLDQIKIEQKNIADAARSQRDQLISESQSAVAEAKKHTALLKKIHGQQLAKNQAGLDIAILRAWGVTNKQLEGYPYNYPKALVEATRAAKHGHRR